MLTSFAISENCSNMKILFVVTLYIQHIDSRMLILYQTYFFPVDKNETQVKYEVFIYQIFDYRG